MSLLNKQHCSSLSVRIYVFHHQKLEILPCDTAKMLSLNLDSFCKIFTLRNSARSLILDVTIDAVNAKTWGTWSANKGYEIKVCITLILKRDLILGPPPYEQLGSELQNEDSVCKRTSNFDLTFSAFDLWRPITW